MNLRSHPLPCGAPTNAGLLAIAVAFLVPWATAPAPAEATGDGAAFVPLFDGRSFAGWEHDDSHWRVEGGAIVGEIPDGEVLRRNLFLFHEGVFHDFELRLAFRITGDPSANSGVQVRSQRTPEGDAAGYQADLDDGAVWAGRIYDEHGRGLVAERGADTTIGPDGTRAEIARAEPASFRNAVRAGDWNEYIVRAVGTRLETWINGLRAAVLIDNQLGAQDFSGQIALQLHAGPGPAKIEFRDVRLADLGRTEPPRGEPLPSPSPSGRDGIVPAGPDGAPLNLGFESGTLEGWTATGDAWRDQPIRGDTVTPRRPGQASEHAGEFWVGGYEVVRHDELTGTLTSAPFEVTQPFASFLVGGGPDRETRVEIVEADTGAVLFTASGSMQENLEPRLVDLGDHLGKRIRIRVVDEHTGAWGHINFDDFRFHESVPEALSASARPRRIRDNPILQHLVRNPAAPEPQSAGESTVANVYLPEGFAADLVAAEPDVVQPIAFTIDERGRLWIAEALSYPQRRPDGEGQDRILILGDEDGDGRFESRKVFAEGLNLVSGLEVGFGGAWVGAAPELLFIPDADGDDVADGPPRVLLDGWGYQDTHETLNSFTWGPDGWLYGNQGVFNTSNIGKPDAPASERTTLHAGVWRYHPVRHDFEIFAHGGSNQWGLDFDEHGELFMTHCRSFWGGGPTTHVVLRGHYWNQANARHAHFISPDAPPEAPHLRNFLRASARYGHGEGGAGKPGSRALYGGHAHVGTMIYLGDNWPEEYRGDLFTHNLHGHQVNRQRNVPRGAGFETIHAGQDLAFIDAPDYVAVDLEYGPDGSVFVIDWADRQHCHSPHMERWDRSNGRVYRIRFAETWTPGSVDLRRRSDLELVELQTHRNAWFARTARRLLQERSSMREVEVGAVARLRQTVEAAGSAPAAVLRALWTLHVTGTLDSATLEQALGHDEPRIRAWGVRMATEAAPGGGPFGDRLAGMGATDPSPVVRLALASWLADAPPGRAWQVAEALAAREEDAGDPYLPRMIWFGIAGHVDADVDRAIGLARATGMPDLRDFVHWFAGRRPEGRERLVAALDERDPDALRRELGLLEFAAGRGGRIDPPPSWAARSAALLDHADPAVRGLARRLGAVFGDATILDGLRATLVDRDADAADRRAAFEQLSRLAGPESAETFRDLLDDPAFRAAVIPLLARFPSASTAEVLLERLGGIDPSERAAAVTTLASHPDMAVPLLEAAAEGAIDRSELTSFHVRQLRALGDARVDRLVAETWGTARETPAERRAVIARFSKAFHEAPLWAYDTGAGRQVFEQVCAVCHSIGGVGGPLGPDLAGAGRNGADYFLENIVDPNAVVGSDYQLQLVTRRDGTVVTGTLENEGADAVTLRTLAGPVTVPAADVAKRETLESSLMPEGILEALSERQVIELLKFLTSLQ